MKMAKNIVYGPLLFIIIIQAFTIFTKPGEAVDFDKVEAMYGIKNTYPSKCFPIEMNSIYEEATTLDLPVTTPPPTTTTTTEEVKEETITDVDFHTVEKIYEPL
uniref:Secreted protein n=1 Tax=Trichobilharzia regenti TaxID=157069 RepID=A0AA85IP22_TRIRE|nr:unnamed protein product [Trichobilharzia regenti]